MTTNVIKRIDMTAFTSNIKEIICFCNHCGPNAKGGQGGILARFPNPSYMDIENLKKINRFCPTCGKQVDWDNITEMQNFLN